MSNFTDAAATLDTAITDLGTALGVPETATPDLLAADIAVRAGFAPHLAMGIFFGVHEADELDPDVLAAVNAVDSALAGLYAEAELLELGNTPVEWLYGHIGRALYAAIPAEWRAYTHTPCVTEDSTIEDAAIAFETYAGL